MSAGARLDAHPVPAADGREEFALWFEGRRVTARRGDTVAAALLAHGVRVFSRSAKYHRPRGVRCMNGTCACCAMRVDGLPGVRTCITPAAPDMRVERERGWPTADRDVLRAAELAAPLMPPGFYYRRFRRSPRLWNAFERLLARSGGPGRLPALADVTRFAGARCERLDGVDVLVVGGGAAGMAAALAAADSGAETLLVERRFSLGGSLPADIGEDAGAAAAAGSPRARGFEIAAHLADELGRRPALRVLTGAEVVGCYEDGLVALTKDPDLLLTRPAALVLASGSHELMPPFPNGDLPGVVSGHGVKRLLHVDRVMPGGHAVVLTCETSGYALARDLLVGGVRVACVADLRSPRQVPGRDRALLAGSGARHVAGVRHMAARGRPGVRGVTLEVEAAAGLPRRRERLACDLVCVAVGSRPADELARQRAAQAAFGLGSAPAHGRLWLAGAVAGSATQAEAIVQGVAAGRAAADAANGDTA